MTKTQHRPLLGIGLMVLGMLLVPLMDACAKVLSRDYPVLEITWARFMFHFLWLLPVVHWQRLPWWKMPPAPGIQMVRSLFLTLATLSFFLAIKENPIPNALALLFISPLVVTLVAPFVLNECFDRKRAGAVVVGFIGVLVVLRPASDEFQPSVLFALGAGVGYACYLMATRKLANRTIVNAFPHGYRGPVATIGNGASCMDHSRCQGLGIDGFDGTFRCRRPLHGYPCLRVCVCLPSFSLQLH